MTSPIDPIRRSRRTREPRSLAPDSGSEPEVPPPTGGAGRTDRVKPPPETPLAEGAAALNAHLLAAHAAGRRTVLIIDEAQNLPRDVLEQVRLLTNLETHKEKLLRR